MIVSVLLPRLIVKIVVLDMIAAEDVRDPTALLVEVACIMPLSVAPVVIEVDGRLVCVLESRLLLDVDCSRPLLISVLVLSTLEIAVSDVRKLVTVVRVSEPETTTDVSVLPPVVLASNGIVLVLDTLAVAVIDVCKLVTVARVSEPEATTDVPVLPPIVLSSKAVVLEPLLVPMFVPVTVAIAVTDVCTAVLVVRVPESETTTDVTVLPSIVLTLLVSLIVPLLVPTLVLNIVAIAVTDVCELALPVRLPDADMITDETVPVPMVFPSEEIADVATVPEAVVADISMVILEAVRETVDASPPDDDVTFPDVESGLAAPTVKVETTVVMINDPLDSDDWLTASVMDTEPLGPVEKLVTVGADVMLLVSDNADVVPLTTLPTNELDMLLVDAVLVEIAADEEPALSAAETEVDVNGVRLPLIPTE